MQQLGYRLLLLGMTVFPWNAISAAAPDPVVLTNKINGHVAAKWAAENVQPAAVADDSAFVRRVYLDVIGRIPTVSETRTFLDDRMAGKRTRLVASLLDSHAHARHVACFWRREWVPQTDTPQFTNMTAELEGWLAQEIHTDAPYDRMVRDLLTASIAPKRGQPPGSFLRASEHLPENLAANTARAFLGLNLDCAQCHDHPFARWTREQFWETAAFFARPQNNPGEEMKFEIAIGDTNRKVSAALLNDDEVTWPMALTPDMGRQLLANWVTSPDNPYFAKNAANRVWAHLFGTGLIEPLDDLSGDTPASHPELLDELAAAFVASGYDLKYLTAAIIGTRAYQLSSIVPKGGSAEPHMFSTAAVRGLTGEQLYDSLRIAAGLSAERQDLDPMKALRDRQDFAIKFHVDRVGTARRSTLQSLSLMNGQLTGDLTDPTKTPMLRALADSPFLDPKQKVEAIALAVFSRPPHAEELQLFIPHVANAGSQGLADVFWVMLISSEFNCNH